MNRSAPALLFGGSSTNDAAPAGATLPPAAQVASKIAPFSGPKLEPAQSGEWYAPGQRGRVCPPSRNLSHGNAAVQEVSRQSKNAEGRDLGPEAPISSKTQIEPGLG